MGTPARDTATPFSVSSSSGAVNWIEQRRYTVKVLYQNQKWVGVPISKFAELPQATETVIQEPASVRVVATTNL